MTNRLAAAGLLLALVTACKGPQETAQTPLPSPETELRQLDTLMVTAQADPEPEDPATVTVPVYRAAQARPHDLLHTTLRLRFDWPGERVLGQATLRMTPTFRPQDSVTLDAKGFEFAAVKLGGAAGQNLRYRYDGRAITVALPRTYTRGQEFELYLDYVATPRAEGGSSAITSDKGLFFIDPRDEDPEKPSQIWTQGETEHNSNWMPTVDQPNERATQDFYVTVDDKYTTLSNGVLAASTRNGDGTRTDHWRMDKPHAPYLHMLAIGEFATRTGEWEGVPLSYHVEPEYAEVAEEIFAHTPEMLTFFSELTGVRYPWPKYAQVAVRDYVSGAMENTTAVIFGEFVQKDARELAEDNNDLIVAHELFHHWFGDLVTCESWSNLTLNEGFANYSEYLWLEHHEGAVSAENHRMNELRGYLGSGMGGGFHPLIWYQWDSNEDMFDAHSYNKGGLVLHMLRGYLGDEAFRAGMKRYLEDNAYTAVEVDELRIAFEDVVGEDLQWFFDQWFLGNGHPVLDVDYGYADGEAVVTVEQLQDPETFRPVFQLPTQIAVYPAAGGPARLVDVTVDRRKQAFRVAAGPEDVVVFDPDTRILAQLDEERTVAEQVRIFRAADAGAQKRLFAIRAIRAAAEEGSYTPDAALVRAAIADDNLRVRNNGIALVDLADAAAVAELKRIAREDREANVRQSALGRLLESDDPSLEVLYREVLDGDASYAVMTTGLQGYFKVNPTAALAKAEELEDSDNDALLAGVAAVYAASGDALRLPFFEQRLAKLDGQSAGEFAAAYLALAFQQGPEAVARAADKLTAVATDQSTSLWRRYGYTSAMAELRAMAASEGMAEQPGAAEAAAALTQRIEAVKAAETNPQLKAVFGRM